MKPAQNGCVKSVIAWSLNKSKNISIGDDIRNINWKATARKAAMMVNNYTEQRSQQVYCIIDKGRLMKMPFEDMSLLDYAINAALCCAM